MKDFKEISISVPGYVVWNYNLETGEITSKKVIRGESALAHLWHPSGYPSRAKAVEACIKAQKEYIERATKDVERAQRHIEDTKAILKRLGAK